MNGILTLPSGTTSYTTHRILHAGKNNSTTIHSILHIPNVELPTFLASPPTPDYVLPEISNLDVETIQQTGELLKEANKNATYVSDITDTREHTNTSFSLLSWIFCSISFTTCLIIFIVGYLSFRYFYQLKKLVTGFHSPIQSTSFWMNLCLDFAHLHQSRKIQFMKKMIFHSKNIPNSRTKRALIVL